MPDRVKSFAIFDIRALRRSGQQVIGVLMPFDNAQKEVLPAEIKLRHSSLS